MQLNYFIKRKQVDRRHVYKSYVKYRLKGEIKKYKNKNL